MFVLVMLFLWLGAFAGYWWLTEREMSLEWERARQEIEFDLRVRRMKALNESRAA